MSNQDKGHIPSKWTVTEEGAVYTDETGHKMFLPFNQGQMDRIRADYAGMTTAQLAQRIKEVTAYLDICDSAWNMQRAERQRQPPMVYDAEKDEMARLDTEEIDKMFAPLEK